MPELPIIDPSVQVEFYYKLKELKEKYLFEALRKTISQLDIAIIDRELIEYVESSRLNQLATYGLRGETFFPIPCLLKKNPYLLGYYRLLYGFSQKEMYSKRGYGRFKRLEERGIIPSALEPEIEILCRSLISSGYNIVSALDHISPEIIRELQLLTIGPQLRGGRNTQVGLTATKDVFNFLKELVKEYTIETTPNLIIIKNNSERLITIQFANDPDICIDEHFGDEVIHLVAIEIKGGADISNIHNRVGEAEKSHQKAKGEGYSQFWTMIRVEIDYDTLKKESPSTTKFFHIDKIQEDGSHENKEFKKHFASQLNIIIQ